jgi:hypothetical protein
MSVLHFAHLVSAEPSRDGEKKKVARKTSGLLA